jgi:hypothetical protein
MNDVWESVKSIPLPAALALGLIGLLIYAKKRGTQRALLGKAGNKKFAKNYA